jgi:tetratricopeptide (TPR) repeat protein
MCVVEAKRAITSCDSKTWNLQKKWVRVWDVFSCVIRCGGAPCDVGERVVYEFVDRLPRTEIHPAPFAKNLIAVALNQRISSVRGTFGGKRRVNGIDWPPKDLCGQVVSQLSCPGQADSVSADHLQARAPEELAEAERAQPSNRQQMVANHHETGKAALKRSDHQSAQVALQQCLELDPSHLGCRWELGWAFWLIEDWSRVVREWEYVEKRDPNYMEIRRWLPEARQKLRLQR